MCSAEKDSASSLAMASGYHGGARSAAQPPNHPTTQYYSALTAAHSSRPKPASLLAAPHRRSTARCLAACFRPAAAFRFAVVGVAAIAAGGPIALAVGAFSLFPASAHASPRALKPNTRLPLNVVLAKVPWKRDSDHPVKEFVPLATLPWKRYFTHPVPEFVPLATLPWANCHVVPLYMPYRPEKRKKWVDPDYNFIMAMCRDKQGNLWLATEGSGIYRYDPSASKGKHWTQFTKQNTHGALANNCIYAIACDNHNRIWAGELNHGVSVFNGKQWQDYDIVQNPRHKALAGPLGNHVFAMKFDRYTDQMWIGTENGISIYQCSGPQAGAIKHHWHYITQANGLPMNPDAIAFGKGGIIYVGTQCGGLAVGTPQGSSGRSNALGWSHYQWTVTKGPWHMPLSATGKGLPSNLINAVAVESGGRVVVGTDGGIAFGPSTSDASLAASAVPSPASLLAAPRRSANNLRHSMQPAPRWASHWTFEHGRNFVAKVYGLWHPPAHWTPPPGQLLEQLPTEDHTTVAAWQPNPAQGARAGYLWLGHWRAGLDVWQYNQQGKIIQRWHIHEPQVGNYIESLQPLKGNAMAVGTYGRGAFIITLPGESKNAWRVAPSVVGENTAAPEPRGARPPGVHELTAMANAIRAELINSSGQKQPRIVPLPDDWRTEGNWLGRYGKYWMCLFAAAPDHSSDIAWGFGRPNMHYLAFMGPHHRRGDSIRRWVQRRFFTGDRRALQVPPPFCDLDRAVYPRRHADGVVRIISELDDHGEAYPDWWQGPDENVLLRIPDGLYILSFYVWNYNGHTSPTRMRDYPIAVQTFPANWRFYRAWYTAAGNTGLPHSCYKRACRVIGRAEENWGGQWVRLLIRGPVIMNVRFQRNYSLNTHVLGAALDWISQKPPPYFCPVASWPQRQANALRAAKMELQALRAGIAPMNPAAVSSTGAAGQALLSLARLQRRAEPATWAISQAMVYATADRWLMATGPASGGVAGAAALRATCNYRLCRFRDWEHDLALEGLPVPRQLEAMTKWKGRLRVFRDGGYHQLARNAARQRIGKIMAAR